MRLPTKRDYASTSMREAKREPVLQDKQFVKAQAAQQRFYGVDPNAYMTLGNAQSRAATAKGNMGLALGNTALKVDAAIHKVDNMLQATAANSAAAKYRDWAANYTADVSNTDLTDFDGKQYRHQTVAEQRKKDSDKFLQGLRKQYQFSDSSIVADFDSKISGINTAHTNRIGEMIRNAEINIGQADLVERAQKGFSNPGEVEEFLKAAEPFYDAKQLADLKIAGLNTVEHTNLRVLLENSQNSNRALQQIEDDLIENQLDNKTYLSPSEVKQYIADIDKNRRINIANVSVSLSSADTLEDLNQLAAEATESGNFSGSNQPNLEEHLEEFNKLYAKNKDRILVADDKKSVRWSDGSIRTNRADHEARLDNAQNLRKNKALTEAGEKELRKSMVDDSIEFHTQLLRAEIENGKRASDIVRDVYWGMDPEQMYLLPGSFGDDKAEVLRKLGVIADGLDKKRDAQLAALQVRTTDEQLAFDIVNGVATNVTTADKKDVVDHMWTVHMDNSIQAQRQGAGFGGTTNNPEKKAPMDEIKDFLNEHNALPSFWVTRMSEAINAGLNSTALNEGNDHSKKILNDATAMLGLLEEYGRMSDGTFMAVAKEYGFTEEHVKLASEIGGRWRHLPPAEQISRTKDYLLREQGMKKPEMVASFKSVNEAEYRDAMFDTEWEEIRKVNPGLPKLTDQIRAVIAVRYKDLYFAGNDTTTGEYAAKLAISAIMGETYHIDGKLHHAMNGKHPLITNIYGSPNRLADENNPVWVTMQDIAAKFEIEDASDLKFVRNAEDTGYMVFGPDGKQLVNMTDNEGNPLPLDKHRQVTMHDDELSESGARLRTGIEIDEKIASLKRTLESTTQDDQNKVLNWGLAVEQSTDAWKTREEFFKYMGSGGVPPEEQATFNEQLAELDESIKAQAEPQLRALEEAKERVKSDDYYTRRLAEEEVKLRQNSTFIVASPEMKQKMLDKITVDLNKLLEAEAEKEAELDYIEDDVERSKANIKAMRDKVKSEQGR